MSSQLTTASQMTLKLLDFRSKTQKYSDNPEFVIQHGRPVCHSCTVQRVISCQAEATLVALKLD